jgi:type IV secretory pathway VirB10-like protein
MLSPLRPRLFRLAAALLFCCAGAAQAQFVWIGPNGTRQYSDQPPPPGTPPSKILKAPGRAAPAQLTPPAPSAPEAAADAAKPKGPPTLAEREADYRKRAKAKEEADRKSEQEAKSAAARTAYCEGLRKDKRVIDSGIRIVDVGPDGKRRYLSDAERAALNQANDKQMSECR